MAITSMGRLSDVITLQTLTYVKNGYGETTQVFSDISSLRCDVKPIRVDEVYKADGERGEIKIEVNVRYYKDAKTSMYLAYNGDRYRIVAIQHVAKRWTVIYAILN